MRICKLIPDTVFCVKSYAQILMQYKVQLTADMYDSTVNLIHRQFKPRLTALNIPDDKSEYIKMRKKVDLAPRLFNAIVRQRKGTASLTSYLNKGKYRPETTIKKNWKMTERVKEPKNKTGWERASLDRNRIDRFQKATYKDNRRIRENQITITDETPMIR